MFSPGPEPPEHLATANSYFTNPAGCGCDREGCLVSSQPTPEDLERLGLGLLIRVGWRLSD